MSRFHSHDGWFFERNSDGSVTITRRIPIHDDFRGLVDGWPVEYVRLDADTWASAVASVSAKGEDGHTFAIAQAFHEGQNLARISITHGPDPMPGGPLPDLVDQEYIGVPSTPSFFGDVSPDAD